jgi:L-threonylcarbamoyladenylate synthase
MRSPQLGRALGALAAGEAVVIPTDTVYGVAARLDRPSALAAIFRAKGRPRDKALPVLADGVEALDGIAVLGETARLLAARFWPGPLTIVVPRAAGFTVDLGGVDDTLAVRVPACPTALALLESSGALAVTSANRSGEPPAATVAEARRALGSSVKVFVDAGRRAGDASTIVSLVGRPRILRPGPLSPEAVLAAVQA